MLLQQNTWDWVIYGIKTEKRASGLAHGGVVGLSLGMPASRYFHLNSSWVSYVHPQVHESLTSQAQPQLSQVPGERASRWKTSVFHYHLVTVSVPVPVASFIFRGNWNWARSVWELSWSICDASEKYLRLSNFFFKNRNLLVVLEIRQSKIRLSIDSVSLVSASKFWPETLSSHVVGGPKVP